MTHQESEDHRSEDREERREIRETRQANESAKSGLSGIILVVLSVVLGATVSLLSWTATTVIELGKEQAKTQQQTTTNTKAIEDINTRGSPVIQAVLARLDSLQAGQARMERALDDHMKVKP